MRDHTNENLSLFKKHFIDLYIIGKLIPFMKKFQHSITNTFNVSTPSLKKNNTRMNYLRLLFPLELLRISAHCERLLFDSCGLPFVLLEEYSPHCEGESLLLCSFVNPCEYLLKNGSLFQDSPVYQFEPPLLYPFLLLKVDSVFEVLPHFSLLLDDCMMKTNCKLVRL